jgi:formylglycine-generating enzyme required for sulfatase activity
MKNRNDNNEYANLLIVFAKKHFEMVSMRELRDKTLPSSIYVNDLYINLGVQADSLGNPARDGFGRLDLEEYLYNQTSATIIGNPGSGKTFFIRHILSNEFMLNAFWPIYINMKSYITMCAEKFISFYDYLCLEIVKIVGDNKVSRNWIQQSISQGEAYLIVEDIDEAAFHTEAMIYALKSLEDYLNIVLSLGNRVLLTSRVVGYSSVRPKLPKTHAECYISGFSDDDIIKFANKWIQVVLHEEERLKKRDNLLEVVSLSAWNREMSTNPYLLTRLAVRSLSFNRDRFYQIDYLDWVIEGLIRGGEYFRGKEHYVRALRDKTLIGKVLGSLSMRQHRGLGKKSASFSEQELSYTLKKTQSENSDFSDKSFFLPHLCDPFCHFLRELNEDHLELVFSAFKYYFMGISLTEILYKDDKKAYEVITSILKNDGFKSIALVAVSAVLSAMQNDIHADRIIEKLRKFNIEDYEIGTLLTGFVLSELPNIDFSYKDLDEIREILVNVVTEKKKCYSPKIKLWAGEVIAKVGDPRKEVVTIDNMNFCEIASGPFYFCHDDTQSMSIDYDYYLSRFPITWSQFYAFSNTSHYNNPDYYPSNCESWLADVEAHRLPFFDNTLLSSNQPAVAITWYEAYAYCKWLTALSYDKGWLSHDWEIRLPSESEWVKAARGGLMLPSAPVVIALSNFRTIMNKPKYDNYTNNNNPKRMYVWENDNDEMEIATGEFGIKSTVSVGAFPRAISAYGCEDMLGNIWEWLSTGWGDNWSICKDLRIRMQARIYDSSEAIMMVKGGSFLVSNGEYAQESKTHLQIDYLTKNHSDVRHMTHGFRVCIVPKNI